MFEKPTRDCRKAHNRPASALAPSDWRPSEPVVLLQAVFFENTLKNEKITIPDERNMPLRSNGGRFVLEIRPARLIGIWKSVFFYLGYDNRTYFFRRLFGYICRLGGAEWDRSPRG